MTTFSIDDLALIVAAWIASVAVLVTAAIVSSRMFKRKGIAKCIATPCTVGISVSLASLPLVAGCWYMGAKAIGGLDRDEVILIAAVCGFSFLLFSL